MKYSPSLNLPHIKTMNTYRNNAGQFISAIQAAEEQHAEIFFMRAVEFTSLHDGTWMADRMRENGIDEDSTDEELEAEAKKLEGWYVWCCLGGCLPEGDALGPYETEKDAAIAYLE